jgi:hypothetical protein
MRRTSPAAVLTRGWPILIGLLIVVVFGTGGPAAAQSTGGDGWRVVSLSGDVALRRNGATPVAFGNDDALRPGDTLQTGPGGRLVLRRGEDTVVVAPNSSVTLPATSPGTLTSLIQSLGTLLVKVDRRATPNFEVRTPYLIAVVKGTSFSVTVDGSGAGVHVLQGQVQVSDARGRTPPVLLTPGSTARVPSQPGRPMQVDGPAKSTIEAAATPAATVAGSQQQQPQGSTPTSSSPTPPPPTTTTSVAVASSMTTLSSSPVTISASSAPPPTTTSVLAATSQTSPTTVVVAASNAQVQVTGSAALVPEYSVSSTSSIQSSATTPSLPRLGDMGSASGPMIVQPLALAAVDVERSSRGLVGNDRADRARNERGREGRGRNGLGATDRERDRDRDDDDDDRKSNRDRRASGAEAGKGGEGRGRSNVSDTSKKGGEGRGGSSVRETSNKGGGLAASGAKGKGGGAVASAASFSNSDGGGGSAASGKRKGKKYDGRGRRK